MCFIWRYICEIIYIDEILDRILLVWDYCLIKVEKVEFVCFGLEEVLEECAVIYGGWVCGLDQDLEVGCVLDEGWVY